MRSYVFTKAERTVVKRFLNHEVDRTDSRVQVILSRLKAFTDLAADIDLYVRLREAVATRPA